MLDELAQGHLKIGALCGMITSSTKNLMIQVEKLYTIKLTEQQAKELYWCLKIAKDQHKLTVDDELVLVLNELKPLFNNGLYE